MVVLEGMLAGEGEPIGTYTAYPKDFTVVVKPFECSLEGNKRIFSENVLACKIAEVKERIEGLGDIWGYIAFECIHEYLDRLSTHESGAVRDIWYLHQCLGVVAGPLLEVATLFEPPETRKKGR